ncbi:winged helix DNA-binding domain-containing protein [Actinosynnema sp. NPDC020468]|uniref:winged helix DNA-binding domain-containing protein n=1 Tax=Actinosynnema sp. NPDC020468 TaxID=3154488 RepID=UPI003405B4B7
MTPAVITDDQRRARLGARHLLPRLGTTVEQVADALVGLHASDPATVYLSAFARLREPSAADVEDALYDRRTLTRLLAMRRTMFAVTTTSAPTVHAAAALAVAAKERAGLVKHLADGVGWDAARLAEVEQATLDAVAAHGEITAADLGKAVPALLEQVVIAPGKPYETRQNVSGRIIRVLAAEGRLRRARPRGSWVSSQFRWAPATPPTALDVPTAQADLVRAWLTTYGPGTEADLKWWTGLTLGAIRKALAAVHAEQVTLSTGTGWVLPGDTDTVEATPWIALLPALDPAPMGWQGRDFYLRPEWKPRLFDYSGNIGPTVWRDGEVIGGWAQRPDGAITWRLLLDAGTETEAAVAAEADRLAALIGDARVVSRFPAPLEKELVSRKRPG